MGDGKNLEELLGSANASLALREFTFYENEFTPRPGDEKELADGVLWLDDKLVVFQTKDRAAASDHSVAGLEKWFKGTIVKEATRQIRDTHDYMMEHDSIVVTNARGHRFDVNTKKFDPVVNVILYGSRSGFPEGFRPRRYHRSSSTGLFMHVLEFTDYVRLCAVLKTPIEMVDYLEFRERYLSEVEDAATRTEKWLLGRFLMSPDIPDPDLDGVQRDLEAAVDNLKDDASDFRAWKFLEGMGDRVDPRREALRGPGPPRRRGHTLLRRSDGVRAPPPHGHEGVQRTDPLGDRTRKGGSVLRFPLRGSRGRDRLSRPRPGPGRGTPGGETTSSA